MYIDEKLGIDYWNQFAMTGNGPMCNERQEEAGKQQNTTNKCDLIKSAVEPNIGPLDV